jgi:hypothetical protein
MTGFSELGALLKKGSENDRSDAQKLAELLLNSRPP